MAKRKEIDDILDQIVDKVLNEDNEDIKQLIEDMIVSIGDQNGGQRSASDEEIATATVCPSESSSQPMSANEDDIHFSSEDEDFWSELDLDSKLSEKQSIDLMNRTIGLEKRIDVLQSSAGQSTAVDIRERFAALLAEFRDTLSQSPSDCGDVMDGTRNAVEALSRLDAINNTIIGLTKQLNRRLK